MKERLALGGLLLAACFPDTTVGPMADAPGTPRIDAPITPGIDAPPGSTPDAPGSLWHVRTSGTAANLLASAFGGQFVAVGAGGVVLTSADGVTWSVGSVGTSDDLLGLTYANLNFLKYVAVGPGVIFTSSTGSSWHKETITGTGANIFQTVIQAHPSLVAMGTGGALVTSPDLTTWTLGNAGVNVVFLGVANSPFGPPAAFVAVGESSSGVVYTTSDPTNGMAFTQRATSLSLLHAVTSTTTAPALIAVGESGSIYTSVDGVAWTPHGVFDDSISWNAVAQCRGFIAAGGIGAGPGSQGVVGTSSDGFAWNVERLEVENLNAIACGTTATVLVGSDGTIVSTAP